MKIVQISTWNVPCGIAIYTKGLIKGMLDNGIVCDVLAIEEKKLKYKTKDEIKEYFQLFVEKLLDYDIIHIQHEFSFFAGIYGLSSSIYNLHYFLRAIIKHNKKVFITFHTEPYFLKKTNVPKFKLTTFSKMIIREIQWKYYICSLFNHKQLNAIVHTKKTRQSFLDSGFSKKSVNIINHGVTLADNISNINDTEKTSLKKQMGFPDKSIILTMFGFISDYKGYETALKSLRILPENYRLLIIGSSHPNAIDITLDKVIKFVNKYSDIKHRVKLTGYLQVEELRNYYNITDICLAPYKAGTILSSSGAITWALSSGKPVIASKIASFDELNEEYECLHLVTPDCEAELAYKIQSLISNIDLNQKIVNNALIYCETNQWRNIAKRHIEIYTK